MWTPATSGEVQQVITKTLAGYAVREAGPAAVTVSGRRATMTISGITKVIAGGDMCGDAVRAGPNSLF